MSFFGFETSLPRDKPQQSQGLFDRQDPFAGLGGQPDDDAEVLDFEETYDGLGQRLQESGDAFNDDTFGSSEPVTQQAVGKDFDFAGQTARARGALVDQQNQYDGQRMYQQPSKPKRTGYEAYKEPEYVQRLEADASIWGTSVPAKKADSAAPKQELASRKMMSLEEVEAMMRNQSQPIAALPQDLDQQSQGLRDMLGVGMPQIHQQPQMQRHLTPQQQQQQQFQQQQFQHHPPPQQPPPQVDYSQRAPQILQRQPQPQAAPPQQHAQQHQQHLPPHMHPQQPPPSRFPLQAPPGHSRDILVANL